MNLRNDIVDTAVQKAARLAQGVAVSAADLHLGLAAAKTSCASSLRHCVLPRTSGVSTKPNNAGSGFIGFGRKTTQKPGMGYQQWFNPISVSRALGPSTGRAEKHPK